MSVLSALRISRKPAAAFVVIGAFWGCFAALVPVLKADLGVDDAMFGTLLLGSAFGLVTAMWLAPRADKVLADRGMQAVALAFAAALLLPGVVTTPVAFFLMMVLLGALSGLLDVLMNARVSELEAQTGRSLMNANHGMFSVAYAIAVLLTGLSREAGLAPMTVFAACAVVICGLALMVRMPVADVPDAQEGDTSPFWPVVVCGAVTLVAFMSEATVEAWSALHIERTLQGGAAEGALGPAMLGLTMALGRFSGQMVSERLREVTVIMAASVLAAAGAVVAATAVTPAMGYLGFGILGLGVSVIGPMGLALVGRLVAPRERTKAISRVAVIAFSGFFFAPVLMGFASEWFGLRMAFGMVAVVLLLAIPLAGGIARMQRRQWVRPSVPRNLRAQEGRFHQDP